jgi:hypothetical protein
MMTEEIMSSTNIRVAADMPLVMLIIELAAAMIHDALVLD